MNASAQNEMERLVRVNREQQTLLDQIYQYVDEQGLAKLGQSRVKALIEAHKRAEKERKMSNYKLVAGGPLHPSQVQALRRNVKRNCPPEIYALLDQAIAAPQPEVSVPEIIEAVANFVGSQEGGPFTPAVIKAAIIGQLECGDAFTKLFTSPAPQPAEQQPGVTQLVEALELSLEYWRHRQQRYKNRRPKWVITAEDALAELERRNQQTGGGV